MVINRRTAMALVSALLAVSPVAFAVTAGASSGVTQIDGLLTPDTGQVCRRALPFESAYTVTGSLDGCWFIEHTHYKNSNRAGAIVAFGTEEFTGCLTGTDRCGSFFTTYTFTAKYDGATELHGRCHHPLQADLGTGAFAGVRGVINMHDLPDGCAIFNGHLDL